MDQFRQTVEARKEEKEEEVNPFARRGSVARSPPRTPIGEPATPAGEERPVLAPRAHEVIDLDLGSPEREDRATAKGAIPKQSGTSKLDRGGPLGGVAKTMDLGRAEGRGAGVRVPEQETMGQRQIESLSSLVREMVQFAKDHKNMHVSLKGRVAKAEVLVRQIERSWEWAVLEMSRARKEERGGVVEEEAMQTEEPEAAAAPEGANKRKEISPCAGAIGKRPRPEARDQEGAANVEAAELATGGTWSQVVRRTGRKKATRQQPPAPAPAAQSRTGAPARRRKKPVRPDAVLIRTDGASSYEEVVRRMKSGVDPAKQGVEVTTIKRTRAGDVLVEVKGGSSGAKKLRDALVDSLGSGARVTALEPSTTVEVRDLDAATEAEEVRRALSALLGEEIPDAPKMRPGFVGTQVALVQVPERDGRKLTAAGRVKVGWTYCRIRERVVVTRCYRCQGYGHRGDECQNIDRTDACRKCGGRGHKENACQAAEPRCVLCAEEGGRKDHFAGSGRCAVFRRELAKAKARSGGVSVRRPTGRREEEVAPALLSPTTAGVEFRRRVGRVWEQCQA